MLWVFIYINFEWLKQVNRTTQEFKCIYLYNVEKPLKQIKLFAHLKGATIQINHNVIAFNGNGCKESQVELVYWVVRIVQLVPVVIVRPWLKVNVLCQSVNAWGPNSISSIEKIRLWQPMHSSIYWMKSQQWKDNNSTQNSGTFHCTEGGL